MSENFAVTVAQSWLPAKAAASWANDWAAGVLRRPREAVPQFSDPRVAAQYFTQHGNPYTGDPVGGLGDFYTHPERVQYALTHPEARPFTSIDCDDVALWFWAALGKGPTNHVMTLVDERVAFSHVILVSVSRYGAFGCDTNGCRPLSGITPADILPEWGRIYPQARYFAALHTPTPAGW